MHIQVNTDRHVEGKEEVIRQIEAVVADALGRFDAWVSRVEVHLSDENGRTKSGDNDKRCVVEARPAGLQPISASHQGATLQQAVSGAARKLARLLDSTAGRLGDPRGRTPYGGTGAV
jgi:ribosome-associated translation inhibitor RaiA